MTKSMTRIGTAVGAALLTVGLGAAALSIAGDQQNQAPTTDGRRGGPGFGGPEGGRGHAAGLAARWDRSADSRCGSSI